MRWLPFLLLLSACTGPDLTVYTRYDTVDRLASRYVETPDPRRFDPNTEGETLILHWIVPEVNGYSLEITRVYHSGDREVDAFYLPDRCGRFEIPLRGCQYIEKGGYLSYQAVLFKDDTSVKVRSHPLYVERITTKAEERRRQKSR